VSTATATPPQGRADYAFFQHILRSLDEQTGRCAILFPHGVLFRKEEAEMRRKLRRKGFSPADIQETVDWLYDRQLLDDAAFAERYIAATLHIKPVGKRWLRAKLGQKGVPLPVVEQILEQQISFAKEKELAAAAALLWKKTHPAKADDKEKLMRFLVSRGFSYDAITECLSSA
jgi:SOS response regulatory protein OraA/RecX